MMIARTLCVTASMAALALGVGAAAASPNDAIINEYWNSDDGTAYASLGGRSIEGDWVELLAVASPEADLRAWRLTNNGTKTDAGNLTDRGSVVLPNTPAFAAVPAGTVILLVVSDNASNDAQFPVDDLDSSDHRMLLFAGNGALDVASDPLFSIRSGDDALVLLSPGAMSAFSDDTGVDFVAENAFTTPATFGVDLDGVAFPTPFTGIGGDDGCIFTNDPLGGFDNDDGTEGALPGDPGPGGWIVDPPAGFSGDDITNNNILTPGARNTGQDLSALIPATPVPDWAVYR